MFGINGGELLILIVVAIIVVGPERMPEYAKQLREWVVGVRTMVDRGRDQLKEEVGDDVDWSKLDPRQYDPRHIVREALNEPSAPPRTSGGASAVSTVAANAAAPVAGTETRPTTLGSHPAPFDSEAT